MKRLAIALLFIACGGITSPDPVELNVVTCPADTATTGSITIIVCLDGICPELPAIDTTIVIGEC